MNVNVKNFIEEGRSQGFRFYMPTDDGRELNISTEDTETFNDFWSSQSEAALHYENHGYVRFTNVDDPKMWRVIRIVRIPSERELIRLAAEVECMTAMMDPSED